jgi:ribosomal protein S3
MIRKHWHFLRLVKLVLNSYWKEYSDKIIGCKIALIGKINGSNRTRKIIIDAGFLNIQRFSSLLDYSLAESFSLFGIFGIKIWLQFF